MFKNWQNKLWFDSSWVLGIWFSWVGRFWLKRPLLAHLSAANAAIAENISLSADSGIQPILNTISATVEWIPEANNFSQFILYWSELIWVERFRPLVSFLEGRILKAWAHLILSELTASANCAFIWYVDPGHFHLTDAGNFKCIHLICWSTLSALISYEDQL